MDHDSCLAALKSSGVVAFPTDTFFALSCDPLKSGALARLRQLKQLDSDRPLPLLAGTSFDPAAHGCTITAPAAQLIQHYWPGKLTVIIPCTGPLAAAVGRPGDHAVGLRVPDGDWLLTLLDRYASPLVGTSANPTGQPPAQTAAEVQAYFHDDIVWIGDRDAGGGLPSTVVDCTGPHTTVVREGAIAADSIDRLVATGDAS